MDRELIWSARAQTELKAIREYIAVDNETAADRMIAEILERMEVVRQVPTIGAPFRDRQAREGRQIVVGKYRIIYRIDERADRVEVITVWHTARRDPLLN
jgi:toxin ParE1/3/4